MHVLTRGKFQHVIARSAATWQSVLLAVEHDRKQYFRRIRKASRIRPRQCQLAKFLCGENGLPHQCAHWFAMTSLVGVRAAGQWCNVLRLSQGTRIATPVCALARNDMQKTGRCQRVQGPPPLSLRGAQRRDNPHPCREGEWGKRGKAWAAGKTSAPPGGKPGGACF